MKNLVTNKALKDLSDLLNLNKEVVVAIIESEINNVETLLEDEIGLLRDVLDEDVIYMYAEYIRRQGNWKLSIEEVAEFIKKLEIK